MSDRTHETLASSAYGLFAALVGYVYGTVVNPVVVNALLQVLVGLVTTVLGAIAIHYVRKALKGLDAMMEGRWLKGLVAAFIGGASNVVTMMIVDPANFNLSDWKKTGTAALVGGVLSVAMYLKSSPIPAQTPQIKS
jgi:hypothetical protein